MTTNTPINVCIVGYGSSAKIFHIPFILALPDRYNLHTIVQRHPTEANSAPHDHPAVTHTTSTSTALSDPSIHLVIITTPPTTHVPLATAALEAGKHVLVEKPFTPTASSAQSLAALAKSKGLQLSVFQNRRYDADFLTLSALLRAGTLGRLAQLRSHFDRHRPVASPSSAAWKAVAEKGNGAVFDLGAHLLDQFVALLGGPPERVTATLWDQRAGGGGEAPRGGQPGGGQPDGEPPDSTGASDTFIVQCHYDALNLLATAEASVVSPSQPHRQLRFWARGTAGAWWKSGLDAQEEQLKAGVGPGAAGFGVDEDELDGVLTVVGEGGEMVETKVKAGEAPTYRRYYEELADALDGKREVPVSADEAAVVIRLIELAIESSESGKTVTFSMP